MRRLKTIIPIAGLLLLILSAVSLYVAMQGLSDIRPAEDSILKAEPADCAWVAPVPWRVHRRRY